MRLCQQMLTQPPFILNNELNEFFSLSTDYKFTTTAPFCFKQQIKRIKRIFQVTRVLRISCVLRILFPCQQVI